MLLAGCLLIILAGCQSAPSVPAGYTATSEPAHTQTSTPTPAPSSTPTIAPTQTPAGTRTPVVLHNWTRMGSLTRDEVWSGEHIVRGDITIAEGATLTIEPGTIVRFLAGEDEYEPNQNLSWTPDPVFPDDPPQIESLMINITILGNFIAEGTDDQPIIFTSTNQENPQMNDWSAIIAGANSNVVITHSVIEYNYNGFALDDNHMNVIIRDNIFRHIAACGICTGGHHAIDELVVIENNIFEDINHEAIDVYVDQNLLIHNNLFYNNLVGIVFTEGSTINVQGNVFYNNRKSGISIHGQPESLIIQDNDFIQNVLNISTMNTYNQLKLENNYWGTQDQNAIASLINGQGDFVPFDTEPNNRNYDLALYSED